MTLTTERLREIAEDGFLEHGDAKLMARELLANRAASTSRPERAAPSAGVNCASDSAETIEKNPKSWAAWKREAERLQAIIDEAQPVMWAHERKLSTDVAITKDAAVAAAWESEGLTVMPLYTAPLAPAVDCEDCGDNPRVACGTCQSLYASAPAVPDEMPR